MGQAIVVGAASATVVVAYGRWIAERLDHERGRLAPDRDMFLVVAPLGLASVAVGLVFWSLAAGAVFGATAILMRRFASEIVSGVRWWRRRRPVRPEDRQRRYERRQARRRARLAALERYGPPAR